MTRERLAEIKDTCAKLNREMDSAEAKWKSGEISEADYIKLLRDQIDVVNSFV